MYKHCICLPLGLKFLKDYSRFPGTWCLCIILLMIEVRSADAFSRIAFKCSAMSQLMLAALPQLRELIAFFITIIRVEGSSAASFLAKPIR